MDLKLGSAHTLALLQKQLAANPHLLDKSIYSDIAKGDAMYSEKVSRQLEEEAHEFKNSILSA